MKTPLSSDAMRSASASFARQGAVPSHGDAAQQQQTAWQREMERAQAASWFKPPIAARAEDRAAAPAAPEISARRTTGGAAQTRGPIVGGTSAIAGLLPALPAESMAADPRTQRADLFLSGTGLPAPGATVRPDAPPRSVSAAHAAPQAGGLAGVQTHRGLAAVQAASVEPAADSAADTESEPPDESRAQPSTASADHAPLRLHEERMSDGQAVWIAMRADDEALATMLPRIVSDLQHALLQERGQRLFQVVCNGRLVWRDGTWVPAVGHTSIQDGNGRSTTFVSVFSKGA